MEPLNAEEQQEVVAAIFQLAEQGKQDAAQKLGDLAEQDPDAVRKILAGEGGDSARSTDSSSFLGS